MLVAGIEYEDEGAELFPDGSVHDATLAHVATIQGVPCASGRSVVFYPSGRLKLAWLAGPAALGGLRCAGGPVVYFHENGQVQNTSLGADHRIGDRLLPVGTRVTFDEAGELLEYDERLQRDADVAGLPCTAEFHIWRYPNGRPSLVVLSAPYKIGETVYPRGARLSFDEAGEVVCATQVDLDSGRRYQQRVFGVYEAAFE